jgi:hypothetical protein
MVPRYRGFGYHRRRVPRGTEREAIMLFAVALGLAQFIAIVDSRIEDDAGERG